MNPTAREDASIRPLLLAMAAWGAVVTVVVCVLDREGFHAVFSEGGPIELLTTPLWVMLAAWCLDPTHARQRAVWVCGGLALMLAMREADFQHNPVVNMSRLKLRYYAQPLVPAHDKLLSAVVTLIALGLLVYAAVLGLRYLRARRREALRPAWARALLVGLVTLAGVKILDRLINGIVDLVGYRIGGLAGRLIGGYEEGFELALPLIFAVALFYYRRSAHALPPPPPA